MMASPERRFWSAMGAYGALAVLATVTLDGKIRIAVWIWVAFLCTMTLTYHKRPKD